MDAHRIESRTGRSVTIASEDEHDVIEVRGLTGAVELRLKLTEDGVVLQFEAARISLKASESVDVDCKSFNVTASADVRIESGAEVHVQGGMIYLN